MCEKCGPSAASIPFQNVENLRLKDVAVTCAKCGNLVKVADASYNFKQVAFNLLYDAGITRQQARRFQRLVAKSEDLDWIVKKSGLINPKLEQVAQIAKKEKEPSSAFKLLAQIAVFVAGSAAFTLAADDLRDRWLAGELFQAPTSQGAHGSQQKRDQPYDKGPKENTEKSGADQANDKFGNGVEI